MNDLEARIIELEIKTAWQDDLLSELNRQIAQMCEVMDVQQRQLRLLYERQNSVLSDLAEKTHSSGHEIPPHY